MLGLSGLGLLTLVTSGTEYGNQIRENRKIINDGIEEYSVNKRRKKYFKQRREIVKACLKHSELLEKMDELIETNHPVTQREKFLVLYFTLNKLREYKCDFGDEVLLHSIIKLNELDFSTSFDKLYIRRFKYYKMTVDLTEATLKLMLRNYDNTKMEETENE